MLVGVAIASAVWVVFFGIFLQGRPETKPETCTPFVHVAAFKDGEQVHQVCRTLDGGLEMKP